MPHWDLQTIPTNTCSILAVDRGRPRRNACIAVFSSFSRSSMLVTPHRRSRSTSTGYVCCLLDNVIWLWQPSSNDVGLQMGTLGGLPSHHMLNSLPSPPNLSNILPSPTSTFCNCVAVAAFFLFTPKLVLQLACFFMTSVPKVQVSLDRIPCLVEACLESSMTARAASLV